MPAAVSRSSLRYLVALLSAPLMFGCNDGDRPAIERIYFSLSNFDGCIVAYARLDLDAATAVLARNDDGSAACEVSPQLESRGCEAEFRETNDGADMHVKISGCQIPTFASLFTCDFTDVEIAALDFGPSANCGCLTKSSSCYVNGICDLCASSNEDFSDCENCDNFLDDDGDGETDCDDADCDFSETCGFGRSTLGCGSTSTLTSTTMDISAAGVATDLAEMCVE